MLADVNTEKRLLESAVVQMERPLVRHKQGKKEREMCLKTYITYVILVISEVMEVKISTKGRYALRMMLDLAQHQKEGFVTLKSIAERQNISKKYLEQIVPLLNNAKMLRTNRGYQGGYILAKSPDQYTVGEILYITEGSLAPVACLDDNPNLCERSGECPTLNIWKGLNKVIIDYLNGITLQDILDQNQNQAVNEYYI